MVLEKASRLEYLHAGSSRSVYANDCSRFWVHLETEGYSHATTIQIDTHLARVVSAPDTAVDFGGLESNWRGATAIGGGHFVVEVCTSQGQDRWKEVRERVSRCQVVGRTAGTCGCRKESKACFLGITASFFRALFRQEGRTAIMHVRHAPSGRDITKEGRLTLSVVSGMEGYNRDGASENSGGRYRLPFPGATDKLRGSRRNCQRVCGELLLLTLLFCLYLLHFQEPSHWSQNHKVMSWKNKKYVLDI